MSYATVMVYVDVTGEMGAHVKVAGALADRFRARLIGISGWAPTSVFLAEEARQQPIPSTSPLQEMKSILDTKGQQFEAAFLADSRGVEWRSCLDFPSDYVAREARAADLLVVGRQFRSEDLFRSLDPGELILKAGRPILFVPNEVTSFPGKRIVIAWKDTREARRAVVDSLPFLEMADSVSIVEVCRDEFPSKLDDVTSFLARHRLNVTSRRLQPMRDMGTTQCLLQFIRSEKVDLVIAGAYGHTRLGEWIFGGVTRSLLRESPICCLFSH